MNEKKMGVDENSIGTCQDCGSGTLWLTAFDFEEIEHADGSFSISSDVFHKIYTCDACKMKVSIKVENNKK